MPENSSMYTATGAVAFISVNYPSGTFAYMVKQYRVRFQTAYAAHNVKLEEICYAVILHATIAAIEAAKIDAARKSDASGCMYELLQLFQHDNRPDVALVLVAAQRAVLSGSYDYALNVLSKLENLR